MFGIFGDLNSFVYTPIGIRVEHEIYLITPAC